jgi:hypothetical protein
MDQVNHESIMDMILMKHHQQTHGEARKKVYPQPHSWGVGKVQGCTHQYVAKNITTKDWKIIWLNERLSS